MALQRVAANSEKECLAPASVEGRGDVEEERHEVADVLHSHRLGVQIEERGSLVLEQSGAKVGGTAICGGVALIFTESSVVFRRRSSRGAFKSGAVEGSTEACVSSVALLLGEGGLTLYFFRTSGHAVALFLGEASGLSQGSGGSGIGGVNNGSAGRTSSSGGGRAAAAGGSLAMAAEGAHERAGGDGSGERKKIRLVIP